MPKSIADPQKTPHSRRMRIGLGDRKRDRPYSVA
jgi:hypothetical protein